MQACNKLEAIWRIGEVIQRYWRQTKKKKKQKERKTKKGRDGGKIYAIVWWTGVSPIFPNELESIFH